MGLGWGRLGVQFDVPEMLRARPGEGLWGRLMQHAELEDPVVTGHWLLPLARPPGPASPSW